VTNVF